VGTSSMHGMLRCGPARRRLGCRQREVAFCPFTVEISNKLESRETQGKAEECVNSSECRLLIRSIVKGSRDRLKTEVTSVGCSVSTF